MSVRSKEGFTIVEVLIAIVILAVGMLALATTSIFATTQVKVADLKTERSLAVQEVVEQLRAGPWSSVVANPLSNGTMAGSYNVWWSVRTISPHLREVEIKTRGPGYISGQGWTTSAPATVSVPANSTATFEVQVTIPAVVEEGASDTATLTATSQANPSTSASIALTTVASQAHIYYYPVMTR